LLYFVQYDVLISFSAAWMLLDSRHQIKK